MRWRGWMGLAASLASLAAAVPQAAARTPDPAVALRPYYRALARDVRLPVAPPGPALSREAPLTRIAFGSCNRETWSQDLWSRIAAADPQLFLMVGDNVYGDTGWTGDAALTTLRQSYSTLAGHREFADFRARVPMLTTWDDHDFGLNDAGADFTYREWAETIFETFWASSPEVRSRPGVQQSVIVGPVGQRVQLIVLDTRFFRSSFRRAPFATTPPPLGPYLPDDSPGATMLGNAQWAWLAGELRKPADVRLLVSSIQVLSTAHDFESWSNLPRERARLLSALKARNGGALLVLSGDRHSGALYSARPEELGEDLWEITSSSMNAPGRPDVDTREPDPLRRSTFYPAENFGLIEIDWTGRTLGFGLRDKAGAVIATQRMPLPR